MSAALMAAQSIALVDVRDARTAWCKPPRIMNESKKRATVTGQNTQ